MIHYSNTTPHTHHTHTQHTLPLPRDTLLHNRLVYCTCILHVYTHKHLWEYMLHTLSLSSLSLSHTPLPGVPSSTGQYIVHMFTCKHTQTPSIHTPRLFPLSHTPLPSPPSPLPPPRHTLLPNRLVGSIASFFKCVCLWMCTHTE